MASVVSGPGQLSSNERVNKMNTEQFRNDMVNAIKRTIAELRHDGTVAMSRDNLWAMVVGKLSRTNGPSGTNAAYVARMIFNDEVNRGPFSRFLIS